MERTPCIPSRRIRALGTALWIVTASAGAAAGQSLLDRVQGLYYPDIPGTTWDCRTLGGDGGALGIQGDRLIGVESACTLTEPFPIPGMDAIRFHQSCIAEGMEQPSNPIILMPSPRGVYLLSDGTGREWLRCPQ